MPARLRTPLAVALLAAAPVLAACQKPTPLVTVQTNGQSYHTEATALVIDGKQHDYDRTVEDVLVKPGDRVGVDVDRSVAKGTWVTSIDVPATQAGAAPGQQALTQATDSHFESFVMPTGTSDGQRLMPGATFVLRVTVTMGETGRTDDRVGQWVFNLKVVD